MVHVKLELAIAYEQHADLLKSFGGELQLVVLVTFLHPAIVAAAVLQIEFCITTVTTIIKSQTGSIIGLVPQLHGIIIAILALLSRGFYRN